MWPVWIYLRSNPLLPMTKHQLPGELRTREWGRVPLWLRERAFFMAGVARGEVLQVFYDVSQELASGKLGLAEGRERARVELAKLGYVPEPGQAGTIKDLRTARRINVALDTNVRMIRGWTAHRKQGLGVAAFPAVQLVRLKRVESPRMWPKRWEEARQGLGGLEGEATAVGAGTPGDQFALPVMAAVWGCPIFEEISRFRSPYAPFDFLSGIGTRAVSRAAAKEMGLDTARAAAYAQEAMQSPGHDLLAEPRITRPALREAVVDSLGGLAKVDGEAIVFTDPNGTRPAPVSELVELLRRPNVDGTRNYQAEAAERLAEGTLREGTDLMDDMGRLVRRVMGAGVDVRAGVHVRVERFRSEGERAARRQVLAQPGGVPLLMGTLHGAGDYGLVIRTRGAVEMGRILGREEGLVSVGPYELVNMM